MYFRYSFLHRLHHPLYHAMCMLLVIWWCCCFCCAPHSLLKEFLEISIQFFQSQIQTTLVNPLPSRSCSSHVYTPELYLFIYRFAWKLSSLTELRIQISNQTNHIYKYCVQTILLWFKEKCEWKWENTPTHTHTHTPSPLLSLNLTLSHAFTSFPKLK